MKVFKAGDVVFDDVVVPEGNEFHEMHDDKNEELHVEWYQNGSLILDIYVCDIDDQRMPITEQRKRWWEQFLITSRRLAEKSGKNV